MHDNFSSIRELERKAEEQVYCNLCGNPAFAGVCEKCWDEMFISLKQNNNKRKKPRANLN